MLVQVKLIITKRNQKLGTSSEARHDCLVNPEAFISAFPVADERSILLLKTGPMDVAESYQDLTDKFVPYFETKRQVLVAKIPPNCKPATSIHPEGVPV